MECPAVFLLLVTLVTWPTAWCAEPSGDFVCSRLDTYEVPMPTKVRRPFEVRYMVWCLKVPPRCPKTKTEFRDEVVMEMVSKTRVVRECCVGYQQREQLCVPTCSDSCGAHGRCVAPDVCKCDPGFHGALCNYGYEIVLPPSISDLLTSTASSPSTLESSTVTSSTTESSREPSQILTTSTIESSTLQLETVTTSSTDRSTSSISTLATENSPGTQISKYIDGNTTISTDNESHSTPTSPVETSDLESSISSPVSSEDATEPTVNHESHVTETNPQASSGLSTETVHQESQFERGNVSESRPQSSSGLSTTTETVHYESQFERGHVAETRPQLTSGLSTETVHQESQFETGHVSETRPQLTSGLSTETVHYESQFETSHVAEPKPQSSSGLSTTTETVHDESQFESSSGYVTETTARHGPSVVVVTNTQNNETSHNYFLQNLDLVTTMTVIIGGSLTVLILALVIVLLCQCRRHNKTAPCKSVSNQRDLESLQEKPLPNIVHSQLPPTPRDFVAGHSGTLPLQSNGTGNVLIVQHVCSMATTNTFKPEPNQATISPALREALEAHYDHPPPSTLGRHSSARVSLSSSQRSPSLAALWDAVMSAAEQPEEHLYDEIPCWNPRLYQRVPAYEEQTSRC